jgi:hypothetical protein
MFVVEDFTQRTVGVQIPTDGPITCCPRCGRNGARRKRFDGTVRYVHVQTSQIFGDGLRTEPADWCTFVGDEDGRAKPVRTELAAPPKAPPAPGW